MRIAARLLISLLVLTMSVPVAMVQADTDLIVVTGLGSTETPGVADSITVTAMSGASEDTSYAGTVTFSSSDGGATLPPDYTFDGSEGHHSFSVTFATRGPQSVTVTDTVTGSLTDTASTTVLNQAPTAVTDAKTVLENAASTAIDVLANDTDPDGDSLIVTLASNPPHGTATVDGGGTGVHYTPDLNYSGPDSFTYNISDGNGGVDTGTVNVTVTHVNQAPTAVTDAKTVLENAASTAIDVLANDTDPDGDSLIVTLASNPPHGTATVDGGGTGVHYTPDLNYSGPDSFTYNISDGNGGVDTGTVNVTVTHVNQAPTAVTDAKTVLENAASTAIDVLANDTDPDGDSLIVTLASNPPHGTATVDGGGTGVHYTPDLNYSGPDSFTYNISDGNGGVDTGTVNVTVTHVNQAPTAVTDAKTVLENAASTAIDVLANDTDPDGDSLIVTLASNPPHGTATVDGGGTGVHYTPDLNYSGPDSFTYNISDGNGGVDTGTVNVTVTHVNQAPTAVTDAKTVLENAASTAIDVLANDTDPDGDSLIVTLASNPPHGTATVDGGGTGVHYTPDLNYSGPDSFTYNISDGNGGVDTGTVNVTVTFVNQVPSFTAGADKTVLENAGAQSISGWATGISPGSGNGEIGQTVTFILTDSNASLFSVAPAVSSDRDIDVHASHKCQRRGQSDGQGPGQPGRV